MDHPVDFLVPLNCPWLFPNLNRRGPWRDGAVGTKPVQRLQAVAQRAGVPGMTFKSLRASWATRAESAGYSGLIIQRVLRHTSPSTSAWYRGHDIEALTRTVADFDY
jgi:integrase